VEVNVAVCNKVRRTNHIISDNTTVSGGIKFYCLPISQIG
jgi:hypothetical protein